MSEFKMRALARYPDGSRGEPFASVSAPGLVICFGAMAAEVGRWLSTTRQSTSSGPFPSAVELSLEWGDPAVSAPEPRAPKAPGASGRRNGRPPRRGLLCGARRRLACVSAVRPVFDPLAGGDARARA